MDLSEKQRFDLRMNSVSNSAHLALVELEADIVDSLKTSEITKLPNISLVCSQPQVSWGMRPQLLEFLAQAQSALDILPGTLSLAVNILDRYMSRRIVYARHYQLLGCVCLWLAAKTVDDKHKVPTSCALAYLCGGSYAESMFSEMELHVLTTLDWSILAPTALDFVDFNVAEVARQLGGEVFGPDEYNIIRCMSQYACECALFSKETSACRPSLVAASAVTLSAIVFDVLESRGWSQDIPRGCARESFDALAAILANPPQEIAERHSRDDQCEATGLFSQFFSALAANSPYSSNILYGVAPYCPNLDYYSSPAEPSTPVRWRHESTDSRGTVSPLDDELASPQGSIISPHTLFVPLTPEEMYFHSNAMLWQTERRK